MKEETKRISLQRVLYVLKIKYFFFSYLLSKTYNLVTISRIIQKFCLVLRNFVFYMSMHYASFVLFSYVILFSRKTNYNFYYLFVSLSCSTLRKSSMSWKMRVTAVIRCKVFPLSENCGAISFDFNFMIHVTICNNDFIFISTIIFFINIY